MHVYAIGDLHLSGRPPSKPMELFGEQWRGHQEKIEADWRARVGAEDAVVLCGDLSWAMSLQAAAPDLEWLAGLPGRKVLLRGNHDYWWSSLAKMQAAYGRELAFLQNNYLDLGPAYLCGTRGWLLPSVEGFSQEDAKIYAREGIRLELSLAAARRAGEKPVIAALHYPPLYGSGDSVFSRLLEQYGVSYCVYGHIHGGGPVSSFEGERGGVIYKLVSCDTQGFALYQVL